MPVGRCCGTCMSGRRGELVWSSTDGDASEPSGVDTPRAGTRCGSPVFGAAYGKRLVEIGAGDGLPFVAEDVDALSGAGDGDR
jgi:hypothetical protein